MSKSPDPYHPDCRAVSSGREVLTLAFSSYLWVDNRERLTANQFSAMLKVTMGRYMGTQLGPRSWRHMGVAIARAFILPHLFPFIDNDSHFSLFTFLFILLSIGSFYFISFFPSLFSFFPCICPLNLAYVSSHHGNCWQNLCDLAMTCDAPIPSCPPYLFTPPIFPPCYNFM